MILINKDDYILGIWYCEKFTGKDKGYAFVIARKPKQRNWQLLIKSFTQGITEKETVALTFDDVPSTGTMIMRAEFAFECAKAFFPDFSEYIEVYGSKEKLLLAIAETKYSDKIK